MQILVVDANLLFLKAAGNFLAALPGCEAVLAQSREEALRLERSQHFDMALIDYALPGAGDLTRRLKMLAPPPLVVLMAPDEAPPYRAACLKAGADACAAKASLGGELPALVARLARLDSAQEH